MNFLLKTLLLIFICSINISAQTILLNGTGSLNRIQEFKSKYVASHSIDVWLPNNYSKQKKYAVIYMQDGQMLFDSSNTWNQQEWKIDETLSTLLQEQKIKDCIVVGVYNRQDYRYSEYFPEDILVKLPKEQQQQILEKQLLGKATANNYIKFLVLELKPYIDSVYSTNSNKESTIIMGSSMGAIISLYALANYPQVFGAAGCLSTHWPVLKAKEFNLSQMQHVAEEFRSYLSEKIKLENGNKFYFSHGNQTLDSLYQPHQNKIDQLFHNKKYDQSNYQSQFFSGDSHSEQSWSIRAKEPILFFLKK